MKNSFLKYFKVVTLGAMVLPFFISSCTEDDEASRPNDNLGPATVTVYNPITGKEGAGVIISGTNFSTILLDNKVYFNGVEAKVRSTSNSTIITSVPVGATTGAITVSVNGKEAAAGPDFTVLLPTIANISPVKGGVGETIVLTGEFFSPVPEENKVWFNGVETTVTEATETSLTVSVPAGAETGTVSVQVKDGTVIAGPSFEVTAEVTFTTQITDANDDVEESVGPSSAPLGTMDLGSSDLELGERDGGLGAQIIGTRFQNVNVPKNATILSAHIQFECDQPGAEPVNLRIHGENVGDSPANTDALFNTSSRPKTTASVLWTVPEWVTPGDVLDAQRTVDLKDIVQEIVNRSDWNANNAMNFIFTQEGDNVQANSGGREAETSKQEGSGPKIVIIYE